MSNKLIVNNTLALYVRVLVLIAIGFYTSRVVLKELGVVDFGLYTLVCSFVALFVFIRGALHTAASRFFAFEIAKGKNGELARYFASTFSLYTILVVALFIALESIGMLFLEMKLGIPVERLGAVRIAYHFSVFSACVSMLQIPMLALLIAHERMGVFAYLSIFESVLKLTAAILISYSPYDKLVSYAALLLAAPLVSLVVFHIHSQKTLPGYQLRLVFDKKVFKELLGYTSWSIVGSVAFVMKMQGINVVLALFHGPAINAARGIALQVNTAILSLAQNSSQAMNPQITKRYASNDLNGMFKLLITGSKISFFLMLFLSMPLFFQADYLLKFWLTEVPEYSLDFVRLILVDSLLGSFAYIMAAAIQATGKMKLYQLSIGGLMLLNLPLAFLALRAGYSPTITIVISILITFLGLWVRLWVLKTLIPEIRFNTIVKDVYGISILVALLSFIPPYVVNGLDLSADTLFLFTCASSVIGTGLMIWMIGLSKEERIFFRRDIFVRLIKSN